MFDIKKFVRDNLLTEASRIDEVTDLISLVAKLPTGTPKDSLTQSIRTSLETIGIDSRGKYPARFDFYGKEEAGQGIWVHSSDLKKAKQLLKKKFPRLEFDPME